MTFARAVEKVSDGDSGHSNVASIDREKFPAERLHPKTVYSRCRPKPASRFAPKQPDGESSPFLFHFYEAAVRDLTH